MIINSHAVVCCRHWPCINAVCCTVYSHEKGVPWIVFRFIIMPPSQRWQRECSLSAYARRQERSPCLDSSSHRCGHRVIVMYTVACWLCWSGRLIMRVHSKNRLCRPDHTRDYNGVLSAFRRWVKGCFRWDWEEVEEIFLTSTYNTKPIREADISLASFLMREACVASDI